MIKFAIVKSYPRHVSTLQIKTANTNFERHDNPNPSSHLRRKHPQSCRYEIGGQHLVSARRSFC